VKAWYTFYAKPHCETRAMDALAERGLSAYVLRASAAQPAPGELLFPRYLFVYGDLAAAGMTVAHHLVGLGEFIIFDNQPAVVPPGLIAWMQAQVGDFGDLAPDSVTGEIESSWPADWRGVLHTGPEQRAETLLRLLWRSNRRSSPASQPVAAAPDLPKRRRRTPGKGRRYTK
jgi:hypothetical protein